MPDANGNLTSLEDFTNNRPFRFISYLDPDVVLACGPTGQAYVHRLSTATAWPHAIDQSVFYTASDLRLFGAASATPGHFFLLPAAVDQDPAHPEHFAEAYAYLKQNPVQFAWMGGEIDAEVEIPVVYFSVPVPVETIKRGAMFMAQGIKALPERMFTVDFVDGCWFALNTCDRVLVMDIMQSRTDEGTPIIGFGWNGGNNQRWRAEMLPAG